MNKVGPLLAYVVILRLDSEVLTVAIHLNCRNCIECLGFDSGPFKKNCSMACSKSIYHEMVNQFTKLNQQCQQKDSEGCWVKFNLEQLVGDDNYRAEILKQRGKLIMKYKKLLSAERLFKLTTISWFQYSFQWFCSLETLNRLRVCWQLCEDVITVVLTMLTVTMLTC